MKAMILAAGLGTRMRPLTEHCPKPLLPLLLQPMLDHILAQLPRHGIRDVIINLHHHADQLARWLGDGSRWGVQLSLSFEPEILGTAGALKREETMFACVQVVDPQVLEHIPPDGFSMTTSDVYPALIERYRAVYGYRYTGYWMDIGAPERYLQAHWDLLHGALGDAWLQRLPAESHAILRPDDTSLAAPGVT